MEKKMSQKHQRASLPDDVLLLCFAHVSRLYYPKLALVSKRFRELLASPMLYTNRSSIGRADTVLYVGIMYPSHPNTQWFTLSRKPVQALASDVIKKNKSSGVYVLTNVKIPNSPLMHTLGLVAVGSRIYNIGGSIGEAPSSRVSVLDCRTNTWSEAPRMKVARYNPSSNVYDNKIYVTGGCGNVNTSKWMEVFDIKTETWEFVVNPFVERCENKIVRSAVMNGELCIFGSDGVTYIPKKDKWELTAASLYVGWVSFSYCVIDDILYCYSKTSRIEWYDIKVGRRWNKLRGLKGLPEFSEYSRVKLADYGGKMVVLWDKYMSSSGCENKVIWCAVIELERDNTGEIWGDVESLDDVLTVPKSFQFVCALSVTV